MILALNARKWWECSGDELWAMNLKRPNFVAQGDECHRRGGNKHKSTDFHRLPQPRPQHENKLWDEVRNEKYREKN